MSPYSSAYVWFHLFEFNVDFHKARYQYNTAVAMLQYIFERYLDRRIKYNVNCVNNMQFNIPNVTIKRFYCTYTYYNERSSATVFLTKEVNNITNKYFARLFKRTKSKRNSGREKTLETREKSDLALSAPHEYRLTGQDNRKLTWLAEKRRSQPKRHDTTAS